MGACRQTKGERCSIRTEQFHVVEDESKIRGLTAQPARRRDERDGSERGTRGRRCGRQVRFRLVRAHLALPSCSDACRPVGSTQAEGCSFLRTRASAIPPQTSRSAPLLRDGELGSNSTSGCFLSGLYQLKRRCTVPTAQTNRGPFRSKLPSHPCFCSRSSAGGARVSLVTGLTKRRSSLASCVLQ